MIRINIKNGSVDRTELLFAKQIDQELSTFAKEYLTKEKCIFKVSIFCELVDKRSEVVSFDQNASFSIAGSIEMAQKIRDYIEKKPDLSILMQHHSLIIHISFKKESDKEKSQENKPMEDKQKKENNALLFIPQQPKYNFNQIILPDSVRKEIFDALKVIECKDVVYNVWGFSECDPVPRSVLNFFGDPGTGKTMCAHAIANKLGKKILALNYAEIESKYVGEAPKNLQKAFDTADETDSVLFFDEADSFLGKRIQNVTQGAEQALNSLRSQMLILLEEHSGVVIFATNLVSNFDIAFESRILKHIHFELPNHDARIEIIKKMIPSKLPLSEPLSQETLDEASDIMEGFSGREIKSAVLELLLDKAEIDATNITFSGIDFINAFRKKKLQKEQLKNEERKILKEKILRKLTEKSEETKLENELKKDDELNNNG